MRIQHLLYEPRRSGISQHVLSVVRCLPQHEHLVLLPEGLTGVAEALTALGARAEVVPMRSRVLPRSALRGLPARLRAANADLVHLHSLEAGGFGALAARLAGARRVIFTPQTVEIRRRALRAPYLRWVRLLGRRHAAWIGVSRGQLPLLCRLARDPQRVHWVPNAAPPRRPLPERSAARRRLGWDPDAPVVACVGRLAAQKDPWTFARALERLGPRAQGVLVGEGPLEAELRAAAQTATNLRLQGFVGDMLDVYAAADVICLTSRWEGLPYSLLESLSHGLPTVASRIDGNVDLIRQDETGLCFPPGDVEALAAALGALLDDPDRARALGQRGQALIEAEFSEAAVGARLAQVYSDALALG